MKKEFKVNIFFAKDGNKLENIISKVLIEILTKENENV